MVAVYIALVAAIGALFHTAWPSGIAGEIIAILVAAFLFQPFRDWIQGRLDRYFYRDRLDYRRTLIEFGRTLTNEVHLDPMLASVMDRISQTLLVDRIAIFLEIPDQPGRYQLSRSMGVRRGRSAGFEFSRRREESVCPRLPLLRIAARFARAESLGAADAQRTRS